MAACAFRRARVVVVRHGQAAATALALGGKKRRAPHIIGKEKAAAYLTHARTAAVGPTSNRNRPHGFPSQLSDGLARKFPPFSRDIIRASDGRPEVSVIYVYCVMMIVISRNNIIKYCRVSWYMLS